MLYTMARCSFICVKLIEDWIRLENMGQNQIVLACDQTQKFFISYKCVNQVTSHNTFYLEPPTENADVNSIHLRSNSSSFVENMSRRVQPLLDTSSHLSFPTTASNNITSMGRDSDLFYFSSGQAAFSGIAFDRYAHVSSHFMVNNRNYTALLHGIENRWECLSFLESKDSLTFSRNTAFPPLKSASTFERKVCQNQIYENSFALNTQRQTDTSLVKTTKDLLSHILLYAVTDVSLNNMCVEWEMKLRHNLSFPEKCHILVYHEVMRAKYRDNPKLFQEECSSIQLLEYDDAYRKNLYGVGRQKRNNPEMIDIFRHIPVPLRHTVLKRWASEKKTTLLERVRDTMPEWKTYTPMDGLTTPSKIHRWTRTDIINVVYYIMTRIKK